MIPQYISIQVKHYGADDVYIIGVVDEDYRFNEIERVTNAFAAMVAIQAAEREYRVSAHTYTYAFLYGQKSLYR